VTRGVNLWDRLFGETVDFEVPGPGGVRPVRVTKRWLEARLREGQVSYAEGEFVQVHVLDPAGENLYYVTTWRLGEDLAKETVANYRDGPNDPIHVMITIQEGKRQTVIMRRDFWVEAKAKLEAI
jgi:hypothetical protein